MPWTKLKNTDTSRPCPSPRSAHTCTLVGECAYVFGGCNAESCLDDLLVLATSSMEWVAPPVAPPVDSGAAAAAAAAPAAPAAPAAVWPCPRSNHAACAVGTTLYIHGGYDGATWLSDLYVLDTAAEEPAWRVPGVAGSAPTARACHTLTTLGRQVFVFGGYDGSRFCGDLHVLDVDAGVDAAVWVQPQVAGVPPQARSGHTSTAVGTRVVVFGGYSGTTHLRDVHVLDTDTMAWSRPSVGGGPPPGMRGHTANLVGTKLFVFGGFTARRRHCRDLHVLDVSAADGSMTWAHPPRRGAVPSKRQDHAACVVQGDRLLVVGGWDGQQRLGDARVLDTTKVEGPEAQPSPRWCRKHMMVLGNDDRSVLFVQFLRLKSHSDFAYAAAWLAANHARVHGVSCCSGTSARVNAGMLRVGFKNRQGHVRPSHLTWNSWL